MIFWFSYQVGAVFETVDCRECTCEMGGEEECRKKECPPCPDVSPVYRISFKCLLALFYCLIHLLIRTKNIKKCPKFCSIKFSLFGNSFLYQFLFHSALNSTFQIISLFCFPFHPHLRNGFQYWFFVFSLRTRECWPPTATVSASPAQRGPDCVHPATTASTKRSGATASRTARTTRRTAPLPPHQVPILVL